MVKKIVLCVVILVILLVAYTLIKQTIEATKSGERLSQAAEAVYKLEVKNKQLKKQLSQIQSPEVLDNKYTVARYRIYDSDHKQFFELLQTSKDRCSFEVQSWLE